MQNIDHLINHAAVLVRSSEHMTDEQTKILRTRFYAIVDSYPEMVDRIEAAFFANNRFWEQHSKATVHYLNDAGVLESTLGV